MLRRAFLVWRSSGCRARHDGEFASSIKKRIVPYADALGLDGGDFALALESDALFNHVRHDFSTGVRSGVNGTSTFFINGERYDAS